MLGSSFELGESLLERLARGDGVWGGPFFEQAAAPSPYPHT
jgi:hypothetical protein